ncbi:MAG: hypothetical protein EA397_15450, partial [Deltaproteobacteria bacterium]
ESDTDTDTDSDTDSDSDTDTDTDTDYVRVELTVDNQDFAAPVLDDFPEEFILPMAWERVVAYGAAGWTVYLENSAFSPITGDQYLLANLARGSWSELRSNRIEEIVPGARYTASITTTSFNIDDPTVRWGGLFLREVEVDAFGGLITLSTVAGHLIRYPADREYEVDELEISYVAPPTSAGRHLIVSLVVQSDDERTGHSFDGLSVVREEGSRVPEPDLNADLDFEAVEIGQGSFLFDAPGWYPYGCSYLGLTNHEPSVLRSEPPAGPNTMEIGYHVSEPEFCYARRPVQLPSSSHVVLRAKVSERTSLGPPDEVAIGLAVGPRSFEAHEDIEPEVREIFDYADLEAESTDPDAWHTISVCTEVPELEDDDLHFFELAIRGEGNRRLLVDDLQIEGVDHCR